MLDKLQQLSEIDFDNDDSRHLARDGSKSKHNPFVLSNNFTKQYTSNHQGLQGCMTLNNLNLEPINNA